MFEDIFKAVETVVDKIVPDAGEAERIKLELQKELYRHDGLIVNAMRDVIVAEAQGDSAAQRNWRPHLMYMIMFLIVWVGVVVPLIEAIFGIKLPVADSFKSIPEAMWSLLQLGVGGYIGGRTLEKTVKMVTGGGLINGAKTFMQKIKEDK